MVTDRLYNRYESGSPDGGVAADAILDVDIPAITPRLDNIDERTSGIEATPDSYGQASFADGYGIAVTIPSRRDTLAAGDFTGTIYEHPGALFRGAVLAIRLPAADSDLNRVSVAIFNGRGTLVGRYSGSQFTEVSPADDRVRSFPGTINLFANYDYRIDVGSHDHIWTGEIDNTAISQVLAAIMRGSGIAIDRGTDGQITISVDGGLGFTVATVSAAGDFATARPAANVVVATTGFARGTADIYLPDGTQPTNVAEGSVWLWDTTDARWERLPEDMTIAAETPTTLAGKLNGAGLLNQDALSAAAIAALTAVPSAQVLADELNGERLLNRSALSFNIPDDLADRLGDNGIFTLGRKVLDEHDIDEDTPEALTPYSTGLTLLRGKLYFIRIHERNGFAASKIILGDYLIAGLENSSAGTAIAAADVFDHAEPLFGPDDVSGSAIRRFPFVAADENNVLLVGSNNSGFIIRSVSVWEVDFTAEFLTQVGITDNDYLHLGVPGLEGGATGLLSGSNIMEDGEYRSLQFNSGLAGSNIPPDGSYNINTGEIVLPEGMWVVTASLNMVVDVNDPTTRHVGCLGIRYGTNLRHAQSIYMRNRASDEYNDLQGKVSVSGSINADGVTSCSIDISVQNEAGDTDTDNPVRVVGAHVHALRQVVGAHGHDGHDAGSAIPLSGAMQEFQRRLSAVYASGGDEGLTASGERYFIDPVNAGRFLFAADTSAGDPIEQRGNSTVSAPITNLIDNVANGPVQMPAVTGAQLVYDHTNDLLDEDLVTREAIVTADSYADPTHMLFGLRYLFERAGDNADQTAALVSAKTAGSSDANPVYEPIVSLMNGGTEIVANTGEGYEDITLGTVPAGSVLANWRNITGVIRVVDDGLSASHDQSIGIELYIEGIGQVNAFNILRLRSHFDFTRLRFGQGATSVLLTQVQITQSSTDFSAYQRNRFVPRSLLGDLAVHHFTEPMFGFMTGSDGEISGFRLDATFQSEAVPGGNEPRGNLGGESIAGADGLLFDVQAYRAQDRAWRAELALYGSDILDLGVGYLNAGVAAARIVYESRTITTTVKRTIFQQARLGAVDTGSATAFIAAVDSGVRAGAAAPTRPVWWVNDAGVRQKLATPHAWDTGVIVTKGFDWSWLGSGS